MNYFSTVFAAQLLLATTTASLTGCNQTGSSTAAALPTAASIEQADSWFSALNADPAALAKGVSAIDTQSIGALQASALAQVTDDAFELGGYHIQGLKTKLQGNTHSLQTFASKYSSLADFASKKQLPAVHLTKETWRSQVALVAQALSKGVEAVVGSPGLNLADGASQDNCNQLITASKSLTENLPNLPHQSSGQLQTSVNAWVGATNCLSDLETYCISPQVNTPRQNPASTLNTLIQAPTSSSPAADAKDGSRRP